MDRITPELVKRAYEVTGLKPVTQSWGTLDTNYAEPCGCPLSVVCVAMEQGHPVQCPADPVNYASSKLGLPRGYILGFINAVDDIYPSTYFKPADYPEGKADGLAVRAMMIEEGLLEA